MTKLFISILFLIFVPQKDLRVEAEKSISALLGKNIETVFEKFVIPGETKKEIERTVRQKFFGETIFRWKVYEKNKLIAAAYLDNVYGKTMPITFLVILNINGEVLTTEIVKYREQYGGGVAEKSWLNQFQGRNENFSLSSGNDISTISGATISSRSITAGVKKIILLNKMINN